MGMTLGFLALGLLPLSEVKAIQYAQPVLVVIFAAMFLGERVRVFRLTAVALGMAGVLVIMWPRLTGLREAGLDPYLALGAIVAFGSAVMAALAHVFVRKLTATGVDRCGAGGRRWPDFPNLKLPLCGRFGGGPI